jgi:hypothetical protein
VLVRLDAAFEVTLGIAVIAATAGGALGGDDFPRPVGNGVLLAVGSALVVLGLVIWSGHVGLRELAAGNGAFAIAGLVWVAAASGFSSAGLAVVAATVAGLAALAAAQAISLRA